ncbi:hypothetical protein [Fibrobacter sp.]|uniref:hypothetical protein n=1 Tax=Fibrobacter sp. TaxID=35828 RepID=UPI0025BE3CCF|nr:hypothetical protein [Fibrobacter sp.]MBR3073600.1 hypothetical protein [Fibrobacter sp.]
MITAISWLILLGPIIKALVTRVIPKLLSRLRGVGGKLTGNAEGLGGGVTVLGDLALGEAVTRTGAIGAVLLVLTRIWGWLSRFPAFLKGLFDVGGVFGFLRPLLEFIVGMFKTPVLVFFSLLISSYFPTILEKFFLLVGATGMRLFLFFFKIGKNVFTSMSSSIGQNGGPLDEYRDAVLGSFDELPPCFVSVMGYLHLLENLGMLVTTATLLLLVSVFRVVYGSFGPKPLGWFA